MPQFMHTLNPIERKTEHFNSQKTCTGCAKKSQKQNNFIFRIANGQGMGPNLLRQTLLEMGMIEFDDSVHSESQWSLWWKGCRFKEEELHSLKETQRVNHHPAPLGRQADIIQKDGLLRAIRRMCATYPKCANLLLYPATYHLPREEGQFVATFKQTARNIKKKLSSAKRPFNHECGEDDKSILLTDSHWLSSSTTTSEDAGNEYTNIWILKPADQSRGKGIFLFDKLEDLIYLTKSVVQRYITNPLLISGYKFDLRLYAVVPSYAPFIVYIHADGLVRFATERFDLGNLSNVYSHLTNSSINVNGPEYLVNKAGIGRGCKWTIKQFRQWMHEQNLDDRLMWIRIQVLIVLTLLSQASSIPKIPNAYEVFGFDILIDAQLRPWLIEVNANPSLACDCIIDEMVKKPLLKSVLEMLELHPPPQHHDKSMTFLDKRTPSVFKMKSRTLPHLTSRSGAQTRSCSIQEKQCTFSAADSARSLESRGGSGNQSDSSSTMSSSTIISIADTDDKSESNLSTPTPLARNSVRLAQSKSLTMHQRFVGQSPSSLNRRVQATYSESLPLYGSGSEHLVRELLSLGKRFSEFIQAYSQITPTVTQGGTTINQSTLRKAALDLIRPYGELSETKLIKDKFFAATPAPTRLDDDRTGSRIIPLSFGQLKLAFPFNLVTRIACAKERGAYPDVKLIVRATSRMITHVTRVSKQSEAKIDPKFMDIPAVWGIQP